MKKLNIVVVGVGGVGSALVPKLCRYCQHIKPQVPVSMILIDGDLYEQNNANRQSFHRFGNKAEVTVEALAPQFDRVSFTSITEYLTPENVDFIIAEGSIVFLCVDNNTTRKEVDDFACTLKNVVVICGGNDMTDGNVQIYVRRKGKDTTASLADIHPEIASPQGKAPYQMNCEELAIASSPQLFFANDLVSALMCLVFYQIMEIKDFLDKPRFGELYFDMLIGRVEPVVRNPVVKVTQVVQKIREKGKPKPAKTKKGR
jgi:molybdopterin/thiamine biosynthesis adenylyltransferase